MGIACRGSVKAGCAAFVNPRTGFLMPVRFSVYGPRGLSCPLPSALAAALQDNARGCGTRCGLRGGRRARAARIKAGALAPAFGLAGRGAKGPPAAKRRRPPQDPGGLLLPYARRTPLGRDDIPCSSCSLRPVLPPPVRPCRCAAGQRQGLRYPLRPQGGAAGARSAHKGGGLGPRLWFGWPGGQRPPGRQTPPPPPGPTGAHYRSGLSLLFSTRFMDTPLALSAGPSCGKSKKAA